MAMEMDDFAGFASEGLPLRGLQAGARRRSPCRVRVRGYAKVNAFYEAAMAAGGKDNGAPGLRPHCRENYYGAWVHDADGNNIEAVCQKPR